MLELGLLDSKMNQFPQSLQAIAAIYMAKKYLKYHNNTSSREISLSLQDFGMENMYTSENVQNCAVCFNKLAGLLQKSKL